MGILADSFHAFLDGPGKSVRNAVAAGGIVGALGYMPSKSFAVGATVGLPAGFAAGGATLAGQISGAVGMRNYMTSGVLTSFGMDPRRVLANGQAQFTGWGFNANLPGKGLFDMDYAFTPESVATKAKWWSKEGLKARAPGNAIGLGMNAFFIYQGYKEGGISGAYDAMALNVAIESSLYHWGYGVGTAGQAGKGMLRSNTKLAGHALKLSTSTALIRGMGAGVGGYIGQQIGLATGIPMAGTIGALAGGYVGGAPLQALRANPILVGGMMAGVAAGAIGYGAYSVVKTAGKMGYAHRQSMRGINTDGDMSAFMTQNAVTMRERSVQAIAKSHLNARSALGQEANFMHSPRNYNSRYR